jgi:diketogulonate reductase-like aldo/keto reductase
MFATGARSRALGTGAKDGAKRSVDSHRSAEIAYRVMRPRPALLNISRRKLVSMTTSQTISVRERSPLQPQAERLSPASFLSLRTGREMPILGLGTWMLTSHTADSVQHAFEVGYRMVDTSADYQTQQGIGKAMGRYHGNRRSLFVTTKVEPEKDGYDSLRHSLEELKLDYVDLVLIHRAPEKGVGEKVWEQLLKARGEGLARDIGVCSYKIDQLKALSENTGEVPAVHQIEWSPFGHSLDMLNYCRAQKIVLQAYSPLTRGKRLQDGKLQEIADKYGKTPAQIILRWNLQHQVVPIPKAYRKDHQRQNLNIFDFLLDETDMATLDGLNEHFSALEKLEYLRGD